MNYNLLTAISRSILTHILCISGIIYNLDTVGNIVTRWVNFGEKHLDDHELLLSDCNV